MARFVVFLFLFCLAINPSFAGQGKAIVYTVDLNKLLRSTEYGKKIISTNNAGRKALQNENEKLEAKLLLEEKELSELRKTLKLSEFRPKAVAFDEKVNIIRSEQSKKEELLIDKARQEEANFFKTIYPLLYELMSDRGGLI